MRPDDPTFHGLAYYITVESFGYLAAAAEEAVDLSEFEQLRADPNALLWVRSYNGSAKRLVVRVRAEDFSWDELTEWTRRFLLCQGERVDTLEPMGGEEIKQCQSFVYSGVSNAPEAPAQGTSRDHNDQGNMPRN